MYWLAYFKMQLYHGFGTINYEFERYIHQDLNIRVLLCNMWYTGSVPLNQNHEASSLAMSSAISDLYSRWTRGDEFELI